MKSLTLSLFLLSCLQLGCHDLFPDGDDLLPNIPEYSVSELAMVPDTAVVAGSRLVLSTSLYRDFMPVTPPGGSALGGMVTISPVATDTLPAAVSADAVWIVKGGEVWKAWLEPYSVPVAPGSPKTLSYAVRNGPKWGPGISVDVVVRILNGKGEGVLLRAEKQSIGATY